MRQILIYSHHRFLPCHQSPEGVVSLRPRNLEIGSSCPQLLALYSFSERSTADLLEIRLILGEYCWIQLNWIASDKIHELSLLRFTPCIVFQMIAWSGIDAQSPAAFYSSTRPLDVLTWPTVWPNPLFSSSTEPPLDSFCGVSFCKTELVFLCLILVLLISSPPPSQKASLHNHYYLLDPL